METMTVPSPSHEASRQQNLIPFAQLSPDLDTAAQYSLLAVVTLVWPYSSSNGAFSLLLAEPDYRLRRQNGQVRVTFRGPCAEQVARTKVGIGDKVTLSLEGARWTENEKRHLTPGKTLEWELQFTHRVKLEAVRNDIVLAVLDFESHQPLEDNGVPTTPSAYVPNHDALQGDLSATGKWNSPAFLRTKTVSSGSPFQVSFSPFMEEDGYIPGRGRKKPRFSFPSSGWRLVDEPARDEPTNEDNWFDSDEEELLRDDDVTAFRESSKEVSPAPVVTSQFPPVGADTKASIGPPETRRESPFFDSTPPQTMSTEKLSEHPVSIRLQGPDDSSLSNEQSSEQHTLATETPRLHPLPSTGLGTPSPIASTPAKSEYLFQAPCSTDSSQHLAPTSVNDQTSESIATSSYPFHDNELPDVAGTTRYVGEAHDVGEPGVDSHLQLPNFPATGGISAATQFESHHTIFPTGFDFGIPPLVGDLAGHPTPQVESSLPVDPSMSGAQQNYHYEKQEEADHDMNLEGEHPDYTYSRYGDTFDIGMERETGYIDKSDLPRQSQIHRAERDTPHTPGEANDEDIHSETERIEEDRFVHGSETDEHELTGYNDAETGEYQMETDDVSSSISEGQERTESDQGSEDVEEDEEMSERVDYSPESHSESEDEIGYGPPQQPERPPNTYPEVIVLDSDSEEEPSRPVQQLSPPRASVSDDEGSDISEQADEYAEYDSVEGSDDGAMDEDEVVTQHSHESGLSEHPIEEESLYEGAEDEQSSERVIVDDESVRVEDERPAVTVREEPLDQQDDVDLYRSTSKCPYEPSIRSDQPSTPSSPKAASSTASFPEDDFKNGPDSTIDNDLSNDKCPSQDSTTGSVSPGAIKLAHETQPLVTRTKLLPTPQPTQEEERPADTGHLTEMTTEYEGSTAEKAGDEDNDPNKSSLHHWTDGSGGDSQSAKLDTNTRVPVIEVNGDALDDSEAPEDHDEVVLLEDRSTSKSVESEPEIYVEASEKRAENEPPSTPRPGKTRVGGRTLAELGDWLGAVVDITAIAVEVSSVERAMSGSKEYYLSLRITDATMAGTTAAVHIFNADKERLPVASEGDVIVLRQFKIQDFDHSTTALSGESSSWAVFHAGEHEPVITGPPVELNADDYDYVQKLREWWYHSGGSAMTADHMLQASIGQEQLEQSPSSVASSDLGSVGSSSVPAGSSQRRLRRKKNYRRVTIHELRDGRYYTEVGSPGGNQSIHELRDGTVYAHPFARD